MKFKILILLLCATHLHAMTMDQFKKLLHEHKAGRVTRQNVISAYDKYKQNIDVQLATNAIRVILKTNIAQLRLQESKAHGQNQSGGSKILMQKPLDELDELEQLEQEEAIRQVEEFKAKEALQPKPTAQVLAQAHPKVQPTEQAKLAQTQNNAQSAQQERLKTEAQENARLQAEIHAEERRIQLETQQKRESELARQTQEISAAQNEKVNAAGDARPAEANIHAEPIAPAPAFQAREHQIAAPAQNEAVDFFAEARRTRPRTKCERSANNRNGSAYS